MNVLKYSLLAVLVVPLIALGQTKRWISLDDTHNFRVELDTKTVTEDTGVVTAWVQGHHIGEDGTDTTQTSYTIITRDKYVCATREMANVMSKRYNALGNPIHDSVSKWPEWEDVIPGTIQEGIFDGICGYATEHDLIHQAGFLDRHEQMIFGTGIATIVFFAFGAGIGWASTNAKARWSDRRSRTEKRNTERN